MIQISPDYESRFAQVGIDERSVFDDERIRPWRVLNDRENCLLELRDFRWHVKRYSSTPGQTPAAREIDGHQALIDARIPTANLVAWGELQDRRSFVIWEDLIGYSPADRLIKNGKPFAEILESTANIAARLHRSGLHHRDLYLCHFMIHHADGDAKLIDAARVKSLPRLLFPRRWIIKDLAQFDFSAMQSNVSEPQRKQWLDTYAHSRGLDSSENLWRSIRRKVSLIARHDARLNRQQPNRNISIPSPIKAG